MHKIILSICGGGVGQRCSHRVAFPLQRQIVHRWRYAQPLPKETTNTGGFWQRDRSCLRETRLGEGRTTFPQPVLSVWHAKRNKNQPYCGAFYRHSRASYNGQTLERSTGAFPRSVREQPTPRALWRNSRAYAYALVWRRDLFLPFHPWCIYAQRVTCLIWPTVGRA